MSETSESNTGPSSDKPAAPPAGPPVEAYSRSTVASAPYGVLAVFSAIMLWITVVLGGVLPPLAVGSGGGHGLLVMLVILLLIAPAVLVGPYSFPGNTRVHAGADGVAVHTLFGVRYAAYRDIVECEADDKRIALRLKNGKRLFVQLMDRKGSRFVADPRQSALVARIRAGMARVRERATNPEEDRCAVGGRSLATWSESLAQSTQQTDYREAPAQRDALLTIVEDPEAEPTARAGAASVLRRVGLTDDERRRVRVAAKETISPRVRVALEKVADETVRDDVAHKAVLRVASR